ncbi:unnamed protein product [Acanthoscelides obtectus]|uniref:Uncharacterized protein n=1 Tax=Acanthoscelides obtectus TaxID=200917 RepID=A0A9P0P0U5_ACAOB|nr:unnamed protein product [Acanthoscelides obtectus]CAK1647025.1 hypothetical protein AOBTE_LOCUS15009 [Acanthoscelides obtectus]
MLMELGSVYFRERFRQNFHLLLKILHL